MNVHNARSRCAGAWLLLASCAPTSVSDATPRTSRTAECAHRLPRETNQAGSVPDVPVSSPATNGVPSHLVVHLSVPLARIAKELEGRVARQLAPQERVSLGPAGVLEYSLERGPLSLSVVRERLVVAAPVQGRAQACSGGRCYASCEPQGVARVELPLVLRPDYRFYPSRVSFEFTRGCKVRLLGGFLTVDVTASLRAELTRRLANAAREIDREIPDVRARLGRAYQELSRPRALPFGCLTLQPEAVLQGVIEDSTHGLHARFALRARPELRQTCDAAPEGRALPELARDLSLPEQASAFLGMEVPLSNLARAFEQRSALVHPHARVAAARVDSAGGAVRARLTLAGAVCGPITVRGKPVFTDDGGAVRLLSAPMGRNERARLQAAGLDPRNISIDLTNAVRVSTPVSLGALRAALPFLASALSSETLAVTPRVTLLRTAGVELREASLLARLEASGSLHVEPL